MSDSNFDSPHRSIVAFNNRKGEKIFTLLAERCPRTFPHKLHGDCPTCIREDESLKKLACNIWAQAQMHYEPLPFRRRVSFAIENFFNWIGSWSKN